MNKQFENKCKYFLNKLSIENDGLFPHLTNIKTKIQNTLLFKKDAVFKSISDLDLFLNAYLKYQKIINKYLKITKSKNDFDSIEPVMNEFIDAFIEYKSTLSILNNKNKGTYFSPQSKFEPSVLEEFISIMISPLINDFKNLKCGPIRAFCEMLLFTVINSEKELDTRIDLKYKNQDVAIYFESSINGNIIQIPVLSIECKTYIDKTMYESCVSTATRIKKSNTESKFFIIAETYDIDDGVKLNDDIDNIFILKKSKRSSKESEFNKTVFHTIYKECSYIINSLSKESTISVAIDTGALKPLHAK